MRLNEYEFKFFLNAKHHITIGGVPGTSHPHSWEIRIRIEPSSTDFFMFTSIEKEVDLYISSLGGKLLNNEPEFVGSDPTMEAIAVVMARKIKAILSQKKWKLIELAVSENPTRSYIIRERDFEDFVSKTHEGTFESSPLLYDIDNPTPVKTESWAAKEKGKWKKALSEEKKSISKKRKKVQLAAVFLLAVTLLLVTASTLLQMV